MKKHGYKGAFVSAALALGMACALSITGCGTAGQTAEQTTGQTAEQVAPSEETETAPVETNIDSIATSDITVYTASGEAVKLASLLSGRPLVINYWATWCPYCVEELPAFQAAAKEYAGRVDFVFVDATDEEETAATTEQWLADRNLSDLTVFYDNDGEAVGAFNVYGLPTTAIISADGRVMLVSAGAMDADTLHNMVESAL